MRDLPKEIRRGKVTIAPGFEIEAVLLDNGTTVITEESLHNFFRWLESASPTIEGVIDEQH